MRIHEYQAKRLFAEYGIPTSPARLTTTPDAAVQAAAELGYPVVLKAQIHAGGRGKAGGIQLAKDETTARGVAHRLIGQRLITPQTGPGGRTVRALLVEKAADLRDELYLAVTVDRARRCVVVMASRSGGVDIEETARTNPEAILKEWADPTVGLRPFQAFRLAHGLGLAVTESRALAKTVLALYRLFCEKDASLAEINPLALAGDERQPLAVDAKVTFDDNGLARHPEIRALRDLDEEDPLEVEATAVNLNYIKLDGNVGCLVNGAGLAMATMDLIQLSGAMPANFLDVGGGATAEMIEKGFRILISDPAVRAIFINIFGGILRCDVLAQGVVAAARAVSVEVPIIVRLEGTNVDAGRGILAASGLEFRTASSLRDAASLVAVAVGKEPR